LETGTNSFKAEAMRQSQSTSFPFIDDDSCPEIKSLSATRYSSSKSVLRNEQRQQINA